MTTSTQSTQASRRHADDGPAEGADAAQTGSFLAEIRAAGGGAEGQADGVLPGKPRRRFPTEHLVTALVLVAGGGALIAMRQYGMGAGMRFDRADKVEYIEPVSRKRTAEQERILSDLQRGVSAAPPQSEDIEKNPFKFLVGAAAPAQPVDDSARRSAEASRKRQAELDSAASAVVLNSIMGGQTPMARVNGEIVREGDKIAGMFTLVAIQGRSILLSADDRLFVVEMSQESGRKPSPPVRQRTPSR